jgi:hypothetical protein
LPLVCVFLKEVTPEKQACENQYINTKETSKGEMKEKLPVLRKGHGIIIFSADEAISVNKTVVYQSYH